MPRSLALMSHCWQARVRCAGRRGGWGDAGDDMQEGRLQHGLVRRRCRWRSTRTGARHPWRSQSYSPSSHGGPCGSPRSRSSTACAATPPWGRLRHPCRPIVHQLIAIDPSPKGRGLSLTYSPTHKAQGKAETMDALNVLHVKGVDVSSENC